MNTYLPENRLAEKSDFSGVFDQAVCKHSTPELLLLARPNTGSVARLGVVVPKKNVRKAVARNRIKRVIRESFRLHKNQLPPWDIVVLALRPADKASNQRLFERLVKGWAKLANQAVASGPELSVNEGSDSVA